MLLPTENTHFESLADIKQPPLASFWSLAVCYFIVILYSLMLMENRVKFLHPQNTSWSFTAKKS